MKINLNLIKLSLISVILINLCACSDTDTPINESELITTFKIICHPINGGDSLVFSFVDLDGDGGNPPIINSPKLKSNTIYQAELSLANEAVSPAVNITQEIIDESSDHQFFYTSTLLNQLLINYEDADSQTYPIGIKTKWITTDTSLGKLTVSLRHQPNKKAVGVKEGNIANAGGETDIEVTFDIIIE